MLEQTNATLDTGLPDLANGPSAPEPDMPPEKAPAETDAHEPSLTVIQPASGWRSANLGEMWRHRELLLFLVWRDLKVRYRQTVLGIAWAVLQPVMMMAVFTVFFGRLANLPSADIPYPLFALTGVLPWLFFAASTSTASNSVLASERMITKIYFPRLLIPFTAVGVAAVDFCIAVCVLGVLMAWYGVVPSVACLVAIPIVFLIGLAGLAFGTGLAALNVRYRDFRVVIPFMIQFWMFSTPTIYMQPPENPSTAITVLMWANPMTSLVGGFRAACLGLPIPWAPLAVAATIIVTVAVISTSYFRKVEDDFADII